MKEQDIIGALAIARNAYAALRGAIRAGAKETALLQAVQAACDGHEIKLDLLSGERTARIEGGATERVLRPGDAVLLDLSVRNNEHWCDVCRTYVLGEPDARFREIYRTVLDGYRGTASLLRPGVSAAALYSAVGELFQSRGMRGCLRHHTGHGIGREPFQPPVETPESTDTLQAGDVMTVEIGAYVTDAFGIRLEDDYLITPNGARCLWQEPIELQALSINR